MANIELSILVAMYEPDISQFNQKIDSLIQALAENIRYEILIHDDSDNVTEVVERCNVYYQHNKKRLGIYDNYNSLLDAARGRYICIYDQDDYFEPDYFLDGIQYLRENDNLGLYCGECKVISIIDNSLLRTELTEIHNRDNLEKTILQVVGGGQSLWMHSIVKNDDRFRFSNMIGADHIFNLLTIISLEFYVSPKSYLKYFEEPTKVHANSERWDIHSSEIEFIYHLFYITYSRVGLFLSFRLLWKLVKGHKKLIALAFVNRLRRFL